MDKETADFYERMPECSYEKTTKHGPYLISELREAFQKVQDKKHWKNPINNVCRTEDKAKVAGAIAFFTGSIAEFEDLSNGWSAVRAEGYYNAIGA